MDQAIKKIRNIGIVAHIDAGKTTTTERILFYAGITKRIGDVDSGTTTTDYMEEEMKRGITITSAAVSLKWRDHPINLMDTPGHVDFTIEVERCLRVVDGVVALFDASVGVQAQSYTVLRQAQKYQTPVIAFLNKMDKSSANFRKAVQSIRSKLEVEPLLVQIPLHGEDGSFEGVVDLVQMKALRFVGDHGCKIDEKSSSELPEYIQEDAFKARHDMITQLTNRDDILSEKLIEALDAAEGDERQAELLLKPQDIVSAIRRSLLESSQKKVRRAGGPLMPVLCGASRRDQGVQPLLDAVVDYLPSPLERGEIEGLTSEGIPVPLPTPSNAPTAPTIALAFKVIHAPKSSTKRSKGDGESAPLVFFRVYCGKVVPRMSLTNHSAPGTQNKTEVVDKLFVMHANQPVEVPAVTAGSIGAAFLSNTSTGHTLYAEPVRLFEKRAIPDGEEAGGGSTPSKGPILKVHTLEGIAVPPSAISFSIEAASASQISLVEDALKALHVEDPSLRYSRNDFGHMIVSGMGELHLEIIMSRLQREYGVHCKLLRAIVEYRECLVQDTKLGPLSAVHLDLPLLDVECELLTALQDNTLDPMAGADVVFTTECEAAFVAGGSAGGSESEKKKALQDELNIIRECFSTALTDVTRLGPLAGCPLVGIRLVVTHLHKRVLSLTHKTVGPAIRTMLASTLQSRLRKGNSVALVEPMMAIEVHLTEATYIGEVVASLNERNAITVDLLEDGRSVSAVVPMRNIVRYTMDLRKAAKGNANFYTKLHHYRLLEDKAILERVLKNLGVR
jgi:elongation factor G